VKEILVSEFKAKCIGLLSAVADGGEELLVTKRGVPLARVLPVIPTIPADRCLGDSVGKVHFHGDIVSDEFSEDWESLRG
jgi:prevent-host-death family protein